MPDLTREEFFARANEIGIPDYMQHSLVDYILRGQPVGHFLGAVLSNNLKEAVRRGDEVNQPLLHLYIRFLWNYAPSACWGSQKEVEVWHQRKGLEGIYAEADERRKSGIV